MSRLAALAVGGVITLTMTLTLVPAGPAAADVPQRQVTLTGAREAPDPGDPDGRGQFTWSLDNGRLCYVLSVKRIKAPTAAHVHRGKVGVAGPVRVTLDVPEPASAACADLSPGVAAALRDHPRRFYVNVHNPKYPAGAIRAQLRR